MAANKWRAIAFDYYGTLVDTDRPFDQIKQWMRAFLERSGMNASVLIDAFFMRFSRERAVLAHGRSYMPGDELLFRSYESACARFHIQPEKKPFFDFVDRLFTEPEAYSDAKSTIEALRGRYKVGLVTNADNDILYRSIRMQRFTFDFVVTSEDAGCNKPQSGIFRKVCKQLKMGPSEILMVGDSYTEDILGATGAGLDAVWINRQSVSSPEDTPVIRCLYGLLDWMEEPSV